MTDSTSPRDEDDHTKNHSNLKTAVSTAIIASTDPISSLEVSAYEISVILGDKVLPDDVRSVLDSANWAYPKDDNKRIWMFDRHVTFADSIDDVISSYPDRYEEGDFR